ncbi:MAG: hypothetical protein ACI8Y7_000726 [Candidatus Woesearchaeota archaeon]|jgi:uncharacterized protein
MHIHLEKHPKKPIIVEGFPGVGLIGTIATEYLIEHLECEQIGSIFSDNIQPMIAMHKGKIVDPIGIFFSEKFNLVIVHVSSNMAKMEWEIADALLQLAKVLDAWEIVCVEGVFDQEHSESKLLYYSNATHCHEKLKDTYEPLQEGLVMGVTGCLLLKAKQSHCSALFASTHSIMPDSIAASKVIEALDLYLGLGVDTKPLLKSAQEFEKKLHLQQDSVQKSLSDKEKKNISYVG